MGAVRDAALVLVGLALLASAARAEIRGRVRRADTLEPIAGATAHVQAAPRPSATTAADGAFALAVEPAGTLTATWEMPPAGSNVDIDARVLDRRALRALAVSKGWTATPDGRPIEREVARAELRIVPGGGFCAGDCDGDGAVRVDELITAVNIALGSAPLSACAAVNVQEDTVVSIGELIGAVNSALDGCP